MGKIKVCEINLPQYHIKKEPDHIEIGQKIDKCLKNYFLGQEVAIRCIGSQEHCDKTVDDLVEIIKKIGHDRYDPGRKGDRYENVDNKHIDFFALDFKIKPDGEYLKYFIKPFYDWPVKMGMEPIRIDIVTVYDLSKLKVVEHQYEGRKCEIKKDGFIFKQRDKKPEAILGIIKVL